METPNQVYLASWQLMQVLLVTAVWAFDDIEVPENKVKTVLE
jgi:hypothetical protein